MEADKEALSGLGPKPPLPWGSWSPWAPTLPIWGIRTNSKGSEKPGRKEHLPGQLPNFQGGVVVVRGVLGSLEARACAGCRGQTASSRLEGAWTVLSLVFDPELSQAALSPQLQPPALHPAGFGEDRKSVV